MDVVRCVYCKSRVMLRDDETCPACSAPCSDEAIANGTLKRWIAEQRAQAKAHEAQARGLEAQAARSELWVGLGLLAGGVAGLALAFGVLLPARAPDIAMKCTIVIAVCAVFGGAARLLFR